MISEEEFQLALSTRAPHLVQWQDAFWSASQQHHVNPFVLVGICERETQGGRFPKYNPGGDGHGWGIMQFDDRSWPPSTIDIAKQSPELTVRDAAWLLAKNMRAFSHNLQAAIAAYNCGTYNASKGLALGNPDVYTTGKNYGAWVIKKATEIRGAPLDA